MKQLVIESLLYAVFFVFLTWLSNKYFLEIETKPIQLIVVAILAPILNFIVIYFFKKKRL
ncbi:hypothetical protein EDM00_04420 [Ornithobacterium rhinotracheale]|uniref:hypothetical protein n=1 Tax=Ornithobacterium rhinotracheale TaxID=28251 RepID=UPI00129C5983|nr:hypothetical protein [Ornithobacterium rhinotracheale]MRI63239.1 hypothetical protein [Ornithobacterium rhinotracheale]MRJ08834.1 hypothetical protein [Ornithobacterium rhinotracheale]MRJ10015.1 hypothetical protein [Ornithobacterium rhinotracheale]UOH77715.1 hypothetical protein MT996_10985 [Ornithobacterium rhinotracheale]